MPFFFESNLMVTTELGYRFLGSLPKKVKIPIAVGRRKRVPSNVNGFLPIMTA